MRRKGDMRMRWSALGSAIWEMIKGRPNWDNLQRLWHEIGQMLEELATGGVKGDKGDTGPAGPAGADGQGVPTGGTIGQHLIKASIVDYDTKWVDPPEEWYLTVASADWEWMGATRITFYGATVGPGGGSGEVAVTVPSLETTDGTTIVDPVTKLTFSGATVTDGGGGEATVTISGGGVEPVEATAGESGIVAGMLVHVGSDGVVWKADATSMIRYCTHAVDSVDGADITCVNVGTLDVLTDDESPYDHTNTYYLSAISKGYATPKPPATTSGTTFAVRQMIGTGQGVRDAGTGKTSITLQLEQGVYI